MMRASLGVLATILACGLFADQNVRADLLTPVSSALNPAVNANADPNNTGGTSASDSQSQGATLNPLLASADATDVSGAVTVEAFVNVNAAFVSADQGAIDFSSVGWNITNPNFDQVSVDDAQGADFAYTFTTSVDGIFSVAYSVSSLTTETFGLNGFFLNLDNNFSQVTVDTAGTIDYSLLANTVYTFTIQNGANILGGVDGNTAMSGAFTFSFRAVPEPSSFALFTVASGLLGIRLWKRRAAV